MKIILIDNYDSFTFNLYHYLSSFSKVDVYRNDKVDHHSIYSKALIKAFALLTVSLNSLIGLLSATIPAPDCT